MALGVICAVGNGFSSFEVRVDIFQEPSLRSSRQTADGSEFEPHIVGPKQGAPADLRKQLPMYLGWIILRKGPKFAWIDQKGSNHSAAMSFFKIQFFHIKAISYMYHISITYCCSILPTRLNIYGLNKMCHIPDKMTKHCYRPYARMVYVF